MTKEEILANNGKGGEEYLDENRYTCFQCKDKDKCHYAWDMYNLNDDCLAEK